MGILLAHHRVMVGQLANVRSRNERLVALPGKYDHADAFIVLDIVERRPQLFHGRQVERVEHFRPVHGDVGNRVFLFDEDVFEVHNSGRQRYGVMVAVMAFDFTTPWPVPRADLALAARYRGGDDTHRIGS